MVKHTLTMSGVKRLQEKPKLEKKWCRDCVYYSEAEFLSCTEYCCDIYGTLDLVFTIEPNDIADKCPDYVQKEGKRWFE